MTYPTLPVADNAWCIQNSDCKTQVFKCCTAKTSAGVSENLCLDPSLKAVPAGVTINVSVNGSLSSVNFGAATYACAATGATGLMVAGATVGMTALMLL